MVLSLFAIAPALAASYDTSVTTTRPEDRLSVRKGPHKGTTPILETVGDRQKITLLAINDQYDPEAWSKIEVYSTGTVGYLKNKYIKYYGLSNSNGELNKGEDYGIDYTNAPDNDGYKGTKVVTPDTPSTTTGVVVTANGGKVNVRKSASSSSAIQGTANDGEALTILGVSGNWYEVRTEKGVKGYIYGDYVQEGMAARTTAKTGLNMRSGPGTGYSILKSLSNGTNIIVLSTTGKWSYVKAGGTYGYVSVSFYQFK